MKRLEALTLLEAERMAYQLVKDADGAFTDYPIYNGKGGEVLGRRVTVGGEATEILVKKERRR